MCSSGSRTFDGGLWKRRNSGSGNSGDSSPGSRKKNRGFRKLPHLQSFFQSLKIRCLYFQAVQVHGGRSFRSGKTAAFRDDLRMPIWREIGEENPQGTIYESVFTGRLGSPVRLDENSYQVDILEMEYENPLETEEIMLL